MITKKSISKLNINELKGINDSYIKRYAKKLSKTSFKANNYRSKKISPILDIEIAVQNCKRVGLFKK